MVKYYVALAFLLHDFQGYKLEKKHCLTLMDDGTERHPDKQGIRDGFKQVLPKHHRQIFSTCCVVVNVCRGLNDCRLKGPRGLALSWRFGDLRSLVVTTTHAMQVVGTRGEGRRLSVLLLLG